MLTMSWPAWLVTDVTFPSAGKSACARLGSSPPAGGPLPKGGFWILHVAGAALAATERHTAHPD